MTVISSNKCFFFLSHNRIVSLTFLRSLWAFKGFINVSHVSEKYAFVHLKQKLLGMGQKRDSNPFNGPK